MTKYRVTFQYSETIYCTNIAIAENIQDVENHYKTRAWYHIEEATDGDIREAERKGMPIITIEHIEETKEEKEEDNNMEERTRTIEEIKEEIRTYFEENEEEYNEVIEDLDSWNGYLGDDRYYNMEELDELYNDTEPTEILTRAFYGYDEMYTDNDGHHPEPFNPNRDYFRYNGYGNLVSTDCKDYTDRLDNYFIDAVIEHAGQLYNIPEEVQELIDEIEELEKIA